MVKRYFSVDSGLFLVIDPCYLDRFMEFFNYDKMIDSRDNQAYVSRVFKSAYPKAKGNNVALVESFGGDGLFSVSMDRLGSGGIEREAPKNGKLRGLRGDKELHAIIPIAQGGSVG